MEAMTFDYDETRTLLARTPATIRALVDGLPDSWLDADEGPGTWSPRRVAGHLIVCDRGNWMRRLEWILEHGTLRPFEPFDQDRADEALLRAPIRGLLAAFEAIRGANLAALDARGLADADLDRTGLHPVLGVVTLRQLLCTWATHDMDHVVQISRVIAKRQGRGVGPWRRFLSVLSDRPPKTS